MTRRAAPFVPLAMLLAAVLLTAMLLAPPPAAAYQLGQGQRLPWLGLTAGGYLSVRGTSLEGAPASLAVHDLSLFLRADLSPRWHFFSETEVEQALTWTAGSRPGTGNAELDLERLYLDRNLTPTATLRIGKFLTPIGRWNQVHADPLVWSVWRPLTTASAFARHATGLELSGVQALGEASLEYRAFLDQTDKLDPYRSDESAYLDAQGVPNPRSVFDRGAGLHLRYRSFDASLQLGVSLARFTLTDQPGARELLGLDLLYGHDGAELTGEAVYRRHADGAPGTEWGGFLQWVQPLPAALPGDGGLYAVLSAERYRAEAFAETVDIASLGLTYRPRPPLSVKLEYREATAGEERLAPDGWLFSIAVLF